MTNLRFDVLAIGNAIVDMLAETDDAFLQEQGLAKGGMILIDAPKAEMLSRAFPSAIMASGGSAANTAMVLADLGGASAYIGKVAADDPGQFFGADMARAGVHFSCSPLEGGPATARCIVLVTPDAQRTMNTYLGACVELGPEDVDEDLVRDAGVVYLEGYLFDPPRAREAFYKAAKVAHATGRKVALSLSDSFCVNRHREAFVDFTQAHVDILFANESEITAFYGTDNLDEAIGQAKAASRLTVITCGKDGAVVVAPEGVVKIPCAPVSRVVDTTGAGDAFAGGFLRGYTQGLPLEAAAVCGAQAAANVIGHYGARLKNTPTPGI